MLCALALLALAAAPLAAQTGGSAFWQCPTSVAGQTLHVYNWTTYIAEDTISNFERLCDVTIVYTTYGSDTDMIDELRAGNPGYDVVVPTDANVYTMIDESLLQRLDVSRIPNFANIGETFKNPPYDPDNGYTVPYQWGTIGVGYNRTTLGRDITVGTMSLATPARWPGWMNRVPCSASPYAYWAATRTPRMPGRSPPPPST